MRSDPPCHSRRNHKDLQQITQIKRRDIVEIFPKMHNRTYSNLIIDLSGQKNGFFEIILSFHCDVSHPKIPN